MFSQLIVNGDFKSDLSGWSNGSSAGGTIAWNSGQYMDLIYTSGTVRANQVFNTVVGKRYRVTMDNVGAKEFFAYGPGTLGTVSAGGKLDAIFTATATSTTLSLRIFSAGTAKVDNVRIQKLSPFNDIIKPADVPTPIFNDIIRAYAGEEPWQAK